MPSKIRGSNVSKGKKVVKEKDNKLLRTTSYLFKHIFESKYE